MKKSWEIKKLSEVCQTGAGGTPLKAHKEYYIGGTIPWLLSGEISQGEIFHSENFITEKGLRNSSARLFPKNTVLIAMYGATAGQVGILRFESSTNQAVCGILPNDCTIPEYLYYCFLSKKDELISQAVGGAQPNISQIKIKNTLIPLPPLPEQKRIVAILDEAFAHIAKAKANAEKNLQNARELFESYLQNVFANPGEDWEVKIIKEVCELKSGTTISTSLERDKGDVLYTKIADMNLPENTIEINTSSRFVNRNEIKQNQIIPEGAIIFPKRGGAIATNKKRKIIKPTIVDLNTMAIIPSKKINKNYFFHWFQLFDLNTISSGANIPQINNYSFDDVYIPYPISLKEQQAIVHKLDSLSTETKKLETIYQQKIEALDEVKKSILQKAFSGELKTTDKKVLA